jgi:hypothetical protein
VTALEKVFALEVFLRRKPMDAEAKLLDHRILAFSSSEGEQTEILPDGLGVLLLNKSQPGIVVVQNPLGEATYPMVSQTHTVIGTAASPRQIVVRVAYADERAKQFLSDEARQLPKEHPGLIMIDMHQAPGGFQAWEPLLRRCFQPTQRTRVGAVCLFQSEVQPTEEGFAWFLRKKDGSAYNNNNSLVSLHFINVFHAVVD